MANAQFLFLDEAGNTGTNFLDLTQPWFVLAGLAVEHSSAPKARQAVADSCGFKRPTEIKGSVQMKTRTGRANALALVTALGQAGCMPFCVFLEKRYNLAARFDHIVYDVDANPRATHELMSNSTARSAAADAIAALPDAILEGVQQALRDPVGANWREVIMAVSGGLRAMGMESQAADVEGAADATLEDLFGENARSTLNPKKLSVNEAAFTALLQLVDQVAWEAGITTMDCVHDETASFADVLIDAHELLNVKSADKARVVYFEGTKIIPLMAIRKLSFAVSHEEPLVQAADVLAAVVNWVCLMGDPSEYHDEPAATEIAALLTAMLFLETVPKASHAIASTSGLQRVWHTLEILRGRGRPRSNHSE